MTSPKIEKTKSEIEKTKAKIAELTSRLREQEREKIRLENEQIVALVRSERISDAELSALMNALRREEPAETGVSENQIYQEDTLNAYQDEN